MMQTSAYARSILVEAARKISRPMLCSAVQLLLLIPPFSSPVSGAPFAASPAAQPLPDHRQHEEYHQDHDWRQQHEQPKQHDRQHKRHRARPRLEQRALPTSPPPLCRNGDFWLGRTCEWATLRLIALQEGAPAALAAARARAVRQSAASASSATDDPAGDQIDFAWWSDACGTTRPLDADMLDLGSGSASNSESDHSGSASRHSSSSSSAASSASGSGSDDESEGTDDDGPTFEWAWYMKDGSCPRGTFCMPWVEHAGASTAMGGASADDDVDMADEIDRHVRCVSYAEFYQFHDVLTRDHSAQQGAARLTFGSSMPPLTTGPAMAVVGDGGRWLGQSVVAQADFEAARVTSFAAIYGPDGRVHDALPTVGLFEVQVICAPHAVSAGRRARPALKDRSRPLQERISFVSWETQACTSATEIDVAKTTRIDFYVDISRIVEIAFESVTVVLVYMISTGVHAKLVD